MANAYSGNPVILDTFTAAIDVAVAMGFPAKTPLKINSIEWQTPTTADHTALISDAVGGVPVFSETCVTAKQSIIKYFHGAYVKGLHIAISGVGSGSIVIVLD